MHAEFIAALFHDGAQVLDVPHQQWWLLIRSPHLWSQHLEVGESDTETSVIQLLTMLSAYHKITPAELLKYDLPEDTKSAIMKLIFS